MVSSEVQRTLVKSPPELWAELSDPEALARHLGELGEIRITHTKPEERVEWEAGSTSGTVLIKPSGWGTKVTLRVTRDIEAPKRSTDASSDEKPAVEDPAAEEPTAESTPTEEESPTTEPLAPEPAEPDTTPTQAEQPDPEPELRRGFFARLFGRRKAKTAEEPELAGDSAAQPSAEADVVAETEPPVPPAEDPQTYEPLAQEEQPEPAAEAPAEPSTDLSAELLQAEEVSGVEVEAVLIGVLDRLGAAHHRPFSRS